MATCARCRGWGRAPQSSGSIWTRTERSSGWPEDPGAAAGRSQEAAPDYLGEKLAGFLDLLASRAPAPAAGATAAIAAGLAGSLTAMVARASEDLPDAAELVARAEELRTRAGQLAGLDAAAYVAVLRASRLPDDPDGGRKDALQDALSAASDVPLEVARIGAEVVELAARLSVEGNPKLFGDALTAMWLAQAAARAASRLVELNLDDGAVSDERPSEARAIVERVARAVGRAERR